MDPYGGSAGSGSGKKPSNFRVVIRVRPFLTEEL